MHHVRPAQHDDVPSWLLLAAEVEPLFGPMPNLRNQVLRAVDRGTALVVGSEGAVDGAMLLSRDEAPHRIAWLAVRQAVRGRGIATALVHAALRRWPDGSVDVVTFTVDAPGGQAAQRLYSHCGFARTGPAEVPPGSDPRDLFVLHR